MIEMIKGNNLCIEEDERYAIELALDMFISLEYDDLRKDFGLFVVPIYEGQKIEPTESQIEKAVADNKDYDNVDDLKIRISVYNKCVDVLKEIKSIPKC